MPLLQTLGLESWSSNKNTSFPRVSLSSLITCELISLSGGNSCKKPPTQADQAEKNLGEQYRGGRRVKGQSKSQLEKAASGLRVGVDELTGSGSLRGTGLAPSWVRKAGGPMGPSCPLDAPVWWPGWLPAGTHNLQLAAPEQQATGAAHRPAPSSGRPQSLPQNPGDPSSLPSGLNSLLVLRGRGNTGLAEQTRDRNVRAAPGFISPFASRWEKEEENK